MPTMLEYTHFHLVGIKGVAMTALAQCLRDAGKTITGSDVPEAFVTQKLLDTLPLTIQNSFDQPLPPETECVIYTAAHGGKHNPQVEAAIAAKLPLFSHAQALGELFNTKDGIAVCGVGGKSTTSAMIAHMLEKLGKHPSFAIGVGNIPSLGKTGQWSSESQFFVAEADEYAMQPRTTDPEWQLVPRFSFLKPLVTVCTNLEFDHPDVYDDFADTKSVFTTFFKAIKPNGTLIYHGKNQAEFSEILTQLQCQTLRFGETPEDDMQLLSYASEAGQTRSRLLWQQTEYHLTLPIPGKYNVLNALGAIAACAVVGLDVAEVVASLSSFNSTQRRFEYIGEKQGVKYYDDYAHHPQEITQVITALNEWFPQERKVIAFQSHTFSRTKELFDEFVDSFAGATEVVMIDIFPSAREAFDSSITSDDLCAAIEKKYPQVSAHNLKTVEALAQFCQTQLKAGDVCITLGAGNIYQVHDLLS